MKSNPRVKWRFTYKDGLTYIFDPWNLILSVVVINERQVTINTKVHIIQKVQKYFGLA